MASPVENIKENDVSEGDRSSEGEYDSQEEKDINREPTVEERMTNEHIMEHCIMDEHMNTNEINGVEKNSVDEHDIYSPDKLVADLNESDKIPALATTSHRHSIFQSEIKNKNLNVPVVIAGSFAAIEIAYAFSNFENPYVFPGVSLSFIILLMYCVHHMQKEKMLKIMKQQEWERQHELFELKTQQKEKEEKQKMEMQERLRQEQQRMAEQLKELEAKQKAELLKREKQTQKELALQEEKRREEKEEMKRKQREAEEKQARKTAERKKNVAADLISSYTEVNNNLLVLKSAIQKEKNNNNQYLDFDIMSKELAKQTSTVEGKSVYFKRLLKAQKEKIATAEDAADELLAVSVFNKEKEEVRKTYESIQKEFEQLKKDNGATPKGRLARSLKSDATKLNIKNHLEIFKLPAKLVHENALHQLRRYVVGREFITKPMKYIMLVGMTGAGKSLLLNNIINNLYGVGYRDKFRFQLVVEEEELKERGDDDSSKSKAESMTRWVTSFCLYYQLGFAVDYSITIIDTPGFGDTRGITYDEKIIDQLRHFFNDNEICPTKELSCIGLVIQASQSRITEEQKYIFDQVLNIFGRDMTENIFLLFTFADAQPPPALEVVEKQKIPFNTKCVLKFNNSAIYAPNDNISSDYSWNFGYDSMKKFFSHLGEVIGTNLSMTKEVLMERDNLKTLLGELQQNIDKGMGMLQNVESMINEMLALDGTMKANKDHTIKSKRYPQTITIVDHDITNCISCMFTCHDPCKIEGDMKEGCASMIDGKCNRCPGKCQWDNHSNGDRIYRYEEVEELVTVEDMLEKYQIALTDKNGKKKLLMKMLGDYRCYRDQVFYDIKSAAKAAKRLDVIALRPTFLTNVTYIERLIESEERSSQPNKKTRLEQLHNFRKMAQTLSEARESPHKLTECISNYEKTVMDAIGGIQDEEGYLQQSVTEFSRAPNDFEGGTDLIDVYKKGKKKRKEKKTANFTNIKNNIKNYFLF